MMGFLEAKRYELKTKGCIGVKERKILSGSATSLCKGPDAAQITTWGLINAP
jgi:hypothetical protein